MAARGNYPLPHDHPDAKHFCSMGAIYRCAGTNWKARDVAVRAANRAADAESGFCLTTFNDFCANGPKHAARLLHDAANMLER